MAYQTSIFNIARFPVLRKDAIRAQIQTWIERIRAEGERTSGEDHACRSRTQSVDRLLSRDWIASPATDVAANVGRRSGKDPPPAWNYCGAHVFGPLATGPIRVPGHNARRRETDVLGLEPSSQTKPGFPLILSSNFYGAPAGPLRCFVSCSFSWQMYSISSSPGRSRAEYEIVNGMV